MTHIRVATYNVMDGGGDRWRDQLAVLGPLELDILCIQEAKYWDRDKQSRLRNTADALQLQPLLAPSRSHGCHLVTLYRWPRIQCTAYIPNLSTDFHHAATHARLKTADDGRVLDLVHTHLDPFSGADRLAEAAWLTEYTDRLTLLAGDLNCIGPDDPEPDDWSRIPERLQSRHRLMREDGTYGDIDRRAIRALAAAGYVDPPARLGIPAARTAGYWSKAERWDHRSDYVLLAPGLAPALQTYEVIDNPATRRLSDHLPVVATFDLVQLGEREDRPPKPRPDTSPCSSEHRCTRSAARGLTSPGSLPPRSRSSSSNTSSNGASPPRAPPSLRSIAALRSLLEYPTLSLKNSCSPHRQPPGDRKCQLDPRGGDQPGAGHSLALRSAAVSPSDEIREGR